MFLLDRAFFGRKSSVDSISCFAQCLECILYDGSLLYGKAGVLVAQILHREPNGVCGMFTRSLDSSLGEVIILVREIDTKVRNDHHHSL